MFDFITKLDKQVMEFGYRFFHNPVVDPIMVVFTYLGEGGAVWIGLIVILFFFKKYRKPAVLTAISLACSPLIVDLLLKNLIHRPRPYVELIHIQLIIPPPWSYSFPSGHACSSFAAAVMIILVFKKHFLSVIAVCLALLIPFTRLYLLVHYPSDILVGALIGTCCALLIFFGYRKWFGSKQQAETKLEIDFQG